MLIHEPAWSVYGDLVEILRPVGKSGAKVEAIFFIAHHHIDDFLRQFREGDVRAIEEGGFTVHKSCVRSDKKTIKRARKHIESLLVADFDAGEIGIIQIHRGFHLFEEAAANGHVLKFLIGDEIVDLLVEHAEAQHASVAEVPVDAGVKVVCDLTFQFRVTNGPFKDPHAIDDIVQFQLGRWDNVGDVGSGDGPEVRRAQEHILTDFIARCDGWQDIIIVLAEAHGLEDCFVDHLGGGGEEVCLLIANAAHKPQRSPVCLGHGIDGKDVLIGLIVIKR